MSRHEVGVTSCHAGRVAGFLQETCRGGDGLFQSTGQTRQTNYDPTQVSTERLYTKLNHCNHLITFLWKITQQIIVSKST